MTLLVVLMWGFGTVLIISAMETDPATGHSVSVLQTIQDIWQNKLSFPSGESVDTGGPGHSPGAGRGATGLAGPPPGRPPVTPPGGGPGKGGASPYDDYRAAVMRAWIQSLQQ